MSLPVPKIVFVCSHISARSQMAEALLKHRSKGQVLAYSAGVGSKQIKPHVFQVMEEVGISLDGHFSKTIDQLKELQPFDLAVVVCEPDVDQCPVFSGLSKEILHWPIESPFPDMKPAQLKHTQKLIHYRSYRDQLDSRITSWMTNNDLMRVYNDRI